MVRHRATITIHTIVAGRSQILLQHLTKKGPNSIQLTKLMIQFPIDFYCIFKRYVLPYLSIFTLECWRLGLQIPLDRLGLWLCSVNNTEEKENSEYTLQTKQQVEVQSETKSIKE